MEAYLGQNIPKLGFGLMRLPMAGENIDIEQVKVMADRFLDRGFSYFDTAYGYNGGASEAAVKQVLSDRYPRDRFLLATKLPAWDHARTKQEAEQMFYTSLERTGAGYFDFYLLHNLGEHRTHFFDDFDLWSFVQERKKEGLIRHVGFSMHDKAEQLDKVLTAHPEVEFVQLQINYADWDSPSVESRKNYEVARRHGKPVIIMEPVKGGTLAKPPRAVAELLKSANPNASLPSWAIRYAASLEGVITVLSGMSNAEQMEDNLSYMEHFQPLTPEEQAVIAQAQALLAATPTIACTSCKYCVSGCPKDVAIPGIFRAVNDYLLYGDLAAARGTYNWQTKGSGHSGANDCIGCTQCQSVCPQHLEIVKELQRAKALFEEKPV